VDKGILGLAALEDHSTQMAWQAGDRYSGSKTKMRSLHFVIEAEALRQDPPSSPSL
jgi:hypothetical protein